eukprot:1587305-Lingulodinium_polyedra.AAC.1
MKNVVSGEREAINTGIHVSKRDSGQIEDIFSDITVACLKWRYDYYFVLGATNGKQKPCVPEGERCA